MKVATTSSNLKGAYIKASKEAPASFARGTSELVRRTGPAHSNTGATRLVEAKLSVVEEGNTALRKEPSRSAACAHECPRCIGSASKSRRPPRKGKSESARLAALERRFEEIGPSIMTAIEERFGDRLRSPEARRRTEHSATCRTIQISSLPREQQGGGWKVVESRKNKKKWKTAAGEAAKKGATAAPLARAQQPQTKTTGAPKSSAATPNKGPTQTSKTATLPHTPRTSEVTLPLSERSKMSYA
jgi:hypothetical protein